MLVDSVLLLKDERPIKMQTYAVLALDEIFDGTLDEIKVILKKYG